MKAALLKAGYEKRPQARPKKHTRIRVHMTLLWGLRHT